MPGALCRGRSPARRVYERARCPRRLGGLPLGLRCSTLKAWASVISTDIWNQMNGKKGIYSLLQLLIVLAELIGGAAAVSQNCSDEFWTSA